MSEESVEKADTFPSDNSGYFFYSSNPPIRCYSFFFRFGASHSQTFTVTLVQTIGPISLHLFLLFNQNFLRICVKVLCKKKWGLSWKRLWKEIPKFRLRRESGEILTLIAKCSAKLRKLQFIVGVESKRDVCYVEAAWNEARRKFQSLNSCFVWFNESLSGQNNSQNTQ